MNVSFIGLGIMGSRMAQNLLNNGISLTVFNRTTAAMHPLVAAGAEGATSAQNCVADADIVFTMLSTPEAVDEVALGELGFVQKMKPNALWVDCSTVDPTFTRQIGARATEAGIRFLEAPVAGSLPQATGAQLVFFCGGEAADVESVTPLMEHMGRKVVHLGAVGMGASLKVLVNSMLAQSMLVFAETLNLGEQLGLSKDFLLEFLPSLPVIAPFVQAKVENLKTGEYPTNFPLSWMQKDLYLVCKAAYEQDTPLLLANATKEAYMAAKQSGLGKEDFSAIYAYLNK